MVQIQPCQSAQKFGPSHLDGAGILPDWTIYMDALFVLCGYIEMLLDAFLDR